MLRWTGRVAMVTGASAGIGAAIANELVLKGMKVVGLARRVDRVEALAAELKAAPGQLHALKCDVTQEADILASFDWVSKNLGGVDVLVNNAGVMRLANLADGATADWRQILQTNVLALTLCTRETLKSMKARGVDDGHIININSVAGHRVVNFPGTAMYSASKHAVLALTEALRNELVANKSKIKITGISPGAVRTEFFEASGMKATGSMEAILKANSFLESKDIADACLYALATPPHVQVHQLTIQAVSEAN